MTYAGARLLGRTSSVHSRFCIHGKQHKRVAGSHIKLTNESATAMSLPMPMSTVVSLRQRRCEFKDHRAATAALGAAPLRAWLWTGACLALCPHFLNTICDLSAFKSYVRCVIFYFSTIAIYTSFLVIASYNCPLYLHSIQAIK